MELVLERQVFNINLNWRNRFFEMCSLEGSRQGKYDFGIGLCYGLHSCIKLIIPLKNNNCKTNWYLAMYWHRPASLVWYNGFDHCLSKPWKCDSWSFWKMKYALVLQ